MLKIKNKKGELIAKLEDEDTQPEFIKKKKRKKKNKEEEDEQSKDEEQKI